MGRRALTNAARPIAADLCGPPSFLARTTNLGRDKEGRFRIGSFHAQSGLVRPRERQIQHGRVPDEVSKTGQQTDHPLRAFRVLADKALRSMLMQLERLYSTTGRLSIPPEQLQRALLFQVLCRVRSERLLMEELDYNPLFRWFVALNRTDRTTFGKNRDRLPAGEVAATFFDAISCQARAAGLPSDE